MKQGFIAEVQDRERFSEFMSESQKRMENSQAGSIFQVQMRMLMEKNKTFLIVSLKESLPDFSRIAPYILALGVLIGAIFWTWVPVVTGAIGSLIFIGVDSFKQTWFLQYAFNKGLKKAGITEKVRFLEDCEILELI